jgi:hypothetical protein
MVNVGPVFFTVRFYKTFGEVLPLEAVLISFCSKVSAPDLVIVRTVQDSLIAGLRRLKQEIAFLLMYAFIFDFMTDYGTLGPTNAIRCFNSGDLFYGIGLGS